MNRNKSVIRVGVSRTKTHHVFDVGDRFLPGEVLFAVVIIMAVTAEDSDLQIFQLFRFDVSGGRQESSGALVLALMK